MEEDNICECGRLVNNNWAYCPECGRRQEQNIR